MTFPAVAPIANYINGTGGFLIQGASTGVLNGYSVAFAGDVNGDGYDDIIVGDPSAAPNGSGSGAAWVVFGGPGGFPTAVDPATLNGANGFRILGAAASNGVGLSVGAAGDVNGDGYDDLLVGAVTGVNVGETYVVFGRASGPAGLTVSALDGTNGFRMDTPGSTNSELRFVASSAGDINGDGYDDLIFGAPYGAPGGQAAVVFGKASGFTANLDPATLDGTNGFRITGNTSDFTIGRASAAADVNGDGYDDVIVGARFTGGAYVVFGKASGFGAQFDLAGIDGANGWRLFGAPTTSPSGWDVDSAGDINADGFEDIIIGAPGGGSTIFNQVGSAYVVFGKASGFAGGLNLTTLDGTNGFRLVSPVVGDATGFSVSGLGDTDGDGFDDVLVSAYRSNLGASLSGTAYVIYGKASGFGASLTLSSLDGSNGFRIASTGANMRLGRATDGGGDINGDGLADILLGAPNTGGGGIAYLLLGRPHPLTFAGTPGADSVTGTVEVNSLSGAGANDILYGLGGDDVIDGGDMADVLYGGADSDWLMGGAGGDTVNGEDGADRLHGDDGADKLFGGAGQDQLYGGAGNDRLEGGDALDILVGGDGNDYLDGGSGIDVLAGGVGNDVYIVDAVSEAVEELAGEGYDITRTSLSLTLAANVEGLELQGGADISGTGNALANNIQGNSGANTLNGAAGVDTLNGNDGDDIVIGGLGNDLLRGGLGADTFRVGHAFGPVLETDQVYDFSTAEDDRIDLSGAWTGTLALVAGFTRHAGEMTLTFDGGATTLRLDVTGDGRVDYQMKINGDVTGDSGGWLL